MKILHCAVFSEPGIQGPTGTPIDTLYRTIPKGLEALRQMPETEIEDELGLKFHFGRLKIMVPFSKSMLFGMKEGETETVLRQIVIDKIVQVVDGEDPFFVED